MTRRSRSCLQKGPVSGQGIVSSHPVLLSPPRRLPNQATTVSPCPSSSWRAGAAADASRRRIGRGGHDTQPLALALADPYYAPNPPTLLLGSSPRDSGLVSSRPAQSTSPGADPYRVSARASPQPLARADANPI